MHSLRAACFLPACAYLDTLLFYFEVRVGFLHIRMYIVGIGIGNVFMAAQKKARAYGKQRKHRGHAHASVHPSIAVIKYYILVLDNNITVTVAVDSTYRVSWAPIPKGGRISRDNHHIYFSLRNYPEKCPRFAR